MDNSEISLGASIGLTTVQAFTTFLGSVNSSDMLTADAYKRGVGLSLGWSFLIATAVGGLSKSYAPVGAWVIASGAMLGSYEWQRDRALGET